MYTDDYPAQFADELTMIFGDYTLGERTGKHVEGEDCSCGFHHDTLDFFEWQISYTDACGQEMYCTINNHESLYYQQYVWLESQIEEHVFSKAFFDAVHPVGHYLVIHIGDIVRSTCNDEQWSHMETAEAYRKELLHSNELIPLYDLSYFEIFNRFPIIISGGIRLEHEGVSADRINSNMTQTVRLTEDTINRLCNEIGDNLNIKILVYTNTSDPAVTQDVRLTYMHGAQVDSRMASCDYENAIFESYVGKFW